MYRFEDPQILILILAIPTLLYVHISRRRHRSGAIRYSDVESLRQADVRHTGRNRHVLFALRVFALAALVVAFARPQTGITSETVSAEGIDIILAMDVSSSMLAEDLDLGIFETVHHPPRRGCGLRWWGRVRRIRLGG